MIKGVVFDMDGLMFDTETIYLRAWAQAGRELGCELRKEQINSIMGMSEQKIRERFFAMLGEDFPVDQLYARKREYSMREMDQNGIPIKKGLFALLRWLKEQDIRAAVATSTRREAAVPMLEKAGVLPYFSSVICGDMVRRGKPDPDIYLQSLQALGLAKEECFGLEDSRNGIFALYNAGIRAVWVPDTVPADEEMLARIYRRVDDLSEVIDLIREENAQP